VQSQNYASLTDPARVGELLLAIDSYDGQPITALALRLAPLASFGRESCAAGVGSMQPQPLNLRFF